MNEEIRLAMARALMDKHGLWDWTISFQDLSRVKSMSLTGMSYGAFGQCRFFEREIAIDLKLLGHRNKFVNTVKHEIAHAIFGRPGHGRDWLKVARRVGCTRRSLRAYTMVLL